MAQHESQTWIFPLFLSPPPAIEWCSHRVRQQKSYVISKSVRFLCTQSKVCLSELITLKVSGDQTSLTRRGSSYLAACIACFAVTDGINS